MESKECSLSILSCFLRSANVVVSNVGRRHRRSHPSCARVFTTDTTPPATCHNGRDMRKSKADKRGKGCHACTREAFLHVLLWYSEESSGTCKKDALEREVGVMEKREVRGVVADNTGTLMCSHAFATQRFV